MDNVIYPELSYKIIGIIYKVYNELGYGFQEKIYQRAIAAEFRRQMIKFKEQLYCNLFFSNEKIAHFYLDFLVENKIVLEIKVGYNLRKRDFEQILSYLKTNNLKLGLLVLISPKGVEYKRILN